MGIGHPTTSAYWVAARFRELGYSVQVTGRGGDHGIDLIAKKPGETAIIQCKNYRTWSVGEPVLRDLYGAMHDQQASRAFLVTTGRLTDSARKWAQGKPLTIWDGDCLVTMGMSVAATVDPPRVVTSAASSSGSISDKSPASPTTEERSASAVQQADPQASERQTATCPKCGMVLIVRRNRTTDHPFLACRDYPHCRHR